MGINDCPICLEKQREIDKLSEEVQRLRGKLYRQQRKEREGFFGSSTPSAQKPIKENTAPKEKKPKGARAGHKGAGRKSFKAFVSDAERPVELESEWCPQCGGGLRSKGYETREVLESRPVKAERVLFRLSKKYCPHCRKTFKAKVPGVLPRSLYGNQLIANAAAMHYLHGLPLGRLCQQTAMGAGSLVSIFHRLARLFEKVPKQLIEEYRQAPVKHADETSWRTDGKSGYVWLFATPAISIFQFGQSRSAKVPQAVFGKASTPGVLVVDRYGAYNKMPCQIQYCYAHLLREVQDLEKDFPDEPEVKTFVATVAPLLSLAMGLRSQNVSDKRFYAQAAQLKRQIKDAMEQPAKHLGIRRIQEIFLENEGRLYHWADDRRIPADNNLAERDLRPSVIARKVSFGSVTDAGAQTRSVLTTILNTLKKRGRDPTTELKNALDQLAANMTHDPYRLLFPKQLDTND
jgi:transposase